MPNLSSLPCILVKSFPCFLFSALLGRITLGDVLTELTCIPVMYPYKSLKYGKYFSFCPLLCEHLNATRVGQLHGNGHHYEGLNLVQQFIPDRIFTFQIHGKFHTFLNYTLTHANTDIYFLFHLAPLITHYEALDYQSSVNLFPSSKFGIEDVNSMFRFREVNLIITSSLNSLKPTSRLPPLQAFLHCWTPLHRLEKCFPSNDFQLDQSLSEFFSILFILYFICFFILSLCTVLFVFCCLMPIPPPPPSKRKLHPLTDV